MSVTNPVIYKGCYLGRLTPEQAELILRTREAKVINNLKHIIYNFDYNSVLLALENGYRLIDIFKDNLDKYKGELRDYQTVGVAFLYFSPRSILGDGVGLGKTAEVAGLLNLLRKKNEMTRFLVGVDNSSVIQILFELTRFTGLKIVEIPSESAKLKKFIDNRGWVDADGYIIKHSGLKSDEFFGFLSRFIKNGKCELFNVFILDESSVVKNHKTKIYQYVKELCKVVDRVHFLNATTFEMNLMDFYNQLDLIDDTLLPRRYRIEENYCRMENKKIYVKGIPKVIRNIIGYKNQYIFRDSLKLVYLARKKSDVGMENKHEYKVILVSPTEEQLDAIVRGYRYMEVLNCPGLIADLNMPTTIENVPKIARLVKLVTEDFDDSKVLVYCFHLEAQEVIKNELESRGKRVVIVNGSDTSNERWEKVQKFNDGEYNVMITNVKRAINLFSADVCIFYTVETNPAKAEQIGGRIDRNVDDKSKTFILLLYDATPEYKFFKDIVKMRNIEAKKFTVEYDNIIDYFVDSLEKEGLI